MNTIFTKKAKPFVFFAVVLTIMYAAPPVRAADYNVSSRESLLNALSDSQTPKNITITSSFSNEPNSDMRYGLGYPTVITSLSSAFTVNGLRFGTSAGQAGPLTLNGFIIDNGFNVLGGNGGVFALNNPAAATLRSMTIINPRVNDSGGVGYLSASGAALNLDGVTVRNTQGNDSAVWGGLVAMTTGGTVLNISGTNSFEGLIAGNAGGAIHITGGTINFLAGNNTVFANNRARGSLGGGAINTQGPSASLSAPAFTVNILADGAASQVIFQNNTGFSGGAIRAAAGTGLNISAFNGGLVRFIGNTATQNTGVNGAGAIYVEDSFFMMIARGAGSRIEILNNTAPTARTGGVYFRGTYGRNTANIIADGGSILFRANSDGGYQNYVGAGAIGIVGGGLNITASNGGNVTFDSNRSNAVDNSAGGIFLDQYPGTGDNPGGNGLVFTTNGAGSSIIFNPASPIGGGGFRDITLYNGNMLVTGTGGYVGFTGGIFTQYGRTNITLTKNGENTLAFGGNGDNSGFNGNYVQTGGIIKFNNTSSMFGTSRDNMRIQGGEEQIVLNNGSDDLIGKAKGQFSGTAALAYLASSTNTVTASFRDPSNVTFANATNVIFGANYNLLDGTNIGRANYILNNDSDFSKANLGRIIFRDSYVRPSQFTYNNNYGLDRSIIDMRDGLRRTTTFNNLTSVNNSYASFDLIFERVGNDLVLNGDMLRVVNPTAGANTIGLADVILYNIALDTGLHLTYTATLLDGLTFSGILNPDRTLTTPVYTYRVTVSGSAITLTADGFNDGNSLNRINASTGTRTFDYNAYGTNPSTTTTLTSNLSPAGAGYFTVAGRADRNDIIDGNGNTMFNLTGPTTLNLSNIALTNASGPNITLASTAAVVNISGSTGTVRIADGIAGSSGTVNKINGGTLQLDGDSSRFTGTFNQTAGTTNIGSGFFGGVSNISSGTLNFNNGSSLASSSSVRLSSPAVMNVNETAGNSLNVNGQVSGSGTMNKTADGTLNLTGNNAGFTGAYNQSTGTTNVSSGTMFGGQSNINGGVLNMNNGSALVNGSTVTLSTPAVMNINQSTFSINGQVAGSGTLNKATDGTLNLTGDNSRFTGTFNQSTGTTNVSSGTFFGGRSNINDGTLNFNDGSKLASSGTVALSTPAVMNINHSSTSFEVNGQVSGTGTVNKTSSGTLNLTGNNAGFTGTYNQSTGTTNISSGTFFGGRSNINDGTLNFNDGSKLASSGTVALSTPAVMNINHSSTSFEVNGQVTGTGTVNKTSSGTLNLTGNNAGFTGAYNQSTGTTNVSSGTMFGGRSNIDGGTLNFNNGSALS
ncbi:MAG: hypothetical protein LBR69_02650, partial [Endomicrobium sp.]|nr:hypothetical protein [Endomicrobium sp.]